MEEIWQWYLFWDGISELIKKYKEVKEFLDKFLYNTYTK